MDELTTAVQELGVNFSHIKMKVRVLETYSDFGY
jgi:hypothetical protein